MKATIIAIIFTLVFLSGSYLRAEDPPQQQPKKYSEHYDHKELARRLSRENLKNIKSLKTSIYNFGEGEQQFQALVGKYDKGMTAFNGGNYPEAAKLLYENEREILQAAKKLATKYKEDTEKILNTAIQMRTADSVLGKSKKNKECEDCDKTADKYLNNARIALLGGNNIYSRFYDAERKVEVQHGSSAELVEAINCYRKAKEQLFLLHRVLISDSYLKDTFVKDYQKDISDNNNQIYGD